MDKSTIYFSVRIPGILGKITPNIKVTIPQRVLYSIMHGAAKNAVRQELKRRDEKLAQTAPAPAPAPTTDSSAPAHADSAATDEPLPPGTVRLSADALVDLVKRKVVSGILDEFSELLESGTVSSLDDLQEYLNSSI